MDIDVYHCPNCDVVRGPSLSECWPSAARFPLSWISPSNPSSRFWAPTSPLLRGVRVTQPEPEFFFSFTRGMGGGSTSASPEAKH